MRNTLFHSLRAPGKYGKMQMQDRHAYSLMPFPLNSGRHQLTAHKNLRLLPLSSLQKRLSLSLRLHLLSGQALLILYFLHQPGIPLYSQTRRLLMSGSPSAHLPAQILHKALGPPSHLPPLP